MKKIPVLEIIILVKSIKIIPYFKVRNCILTLQ